MSHERFKQLLRKIKNHL